MESYFGYDSIFVWWTVAIVFVCVLAFRVGPVLLLKYIVCQLRAALISSEAVRWRCCCCVVKLVCSLLLATTPAILAGVPERPKGFLSPCPASPSPDQGLQSLLCPA